MPLRAILYDHDGTLVDSETTHCRLWLDVMQRHGVAFTAQHYQAHYAGVPNAASAVDMVQRFGLSMRPEDLAAEKEAATRDYLLHASFELMPGARASIAFFLQAGLRLAVVTGARRYGVDASLRGHGLGDRFASVVSADDVRHSKPAPDCYLLALQQLGLQPDECVAIEDTAHGVAAARGAGLCCVAVPTAMSAHQDFSAASVLLQGGLAAATTWIAERHGLGA